jgi:hypothetical protein
LAQLSATGGAQAHGICILLEVIALETGHLCADRLIAHHAVLVLVSQNALLHRIQRSDGQRLRRLLTRKRTRALSDAATAT